MKVLTPIALFALSIGLFFWFITPTWAEISTLNAELSTYKDALSQARTAVAKRNDLVNRRNSIDPEDLARLEAILPDSIDSLRLAVDINEFGKKHDANLKNLRIGAATDSYQAPTAEGQVYGILPISFTVSLSYSDFLLFMRDLEKTLKLVDPATVNFTPTEKGIYDFSVTLKTYWLK